MIRKCGFCIRVTMRARLLQWSRGRSVVTDSDDKLRLALTHLVELVGEAPVKYIDLTEEKVEKIFQGHVLGGKIEKEYALAIGSERVS